MKKFAERLGLLSALLSVAALLRLPGRTLAALEHRLAQRGARPLGAALKWGIATPFVGAKLAGSLFAPVIAVLGLASAVLGVSGCSGAALISGLLGAALSLRHTRRVTAHHEGFEAAFGPEWADRIPDSLWEKLPSSRWQVPAIRRARPAVWRRRNVVYGRHEGTGQALVCDMWLPPDGISATGLGVLYLHGSAWQAFDKGMLLADSFRRLVDQGHVVADIRYTLAPQTDMFGMLRDVKRAIAWMQSDGDIYGIDPERVVVWGSSGGGHLALLAAYTPGHPAFQPEGIADGKPVRGVVSAYGPTDLTAHWYEYARYVPDQPEFSDRVSTALQPYDHDTTRFDTLLTEYGFWPAYRYGNTPDSPLLLVNLMGGTLLEAPENYRLCSPLAHVSPDCPPTLQLWGAHDYYFSPEHGRRLHRALTGAGVPSIYVEFPDTEHGFDTLAPSLTPAGQAARYDIEHFLALLV